MGQEFMMWFLSYCPFWLCDSLAGDDRGCYACVLSVVWLSLPCSDAGWSVLVVLPDPEVIKHFSCSTQLSTNFILLINCWHFSIYYDKCHI